jgi:hypothetical protein
MSLPDALIEFTVPDTVWASRITRRFCRSHDRFVVGSPPSVSNSIRFSADVSPSQVQDPALYPV